MPRNGTVSKATSSEPSPIVSPEIQPASSLSSTDHPVTSPLLDAASGTGTSYTTSTSPGAQDWPRGLSPGMAGSPGNLINFVGESPPTAPSSYEDARGAPGRAGPTLPRPIAAHHTPASASPPIVGRRPFSLHMDSHYSPPDTHLPLSAAAVARRGSLNSPYVHGRIVSNPPLPHHPQAHFYGAAPLDLDPTPRSGMKAGEKGYYFGFDVLTLPSVDRAPGKDTVVLAGYEGGLEVFSVSRRGVEHVANLKGLRGGVYHAKVLPWTSASSDLFPLVAVVVHGPILPQRTSEGGVEGGDYDPVSADRSDAMINSPAPSVKNAGSSKTGAGLIEAYQTSVEVWSLKTGQQFCVLLEAPKIPLKTSITSPSFHAPPPTGAFHIHADGGNIIVSSGVTGECWVYRQMPPVGELPLHFGCIGKLWTTLQQPPKGDTPQEPDWSRIPGPSSPRPRPQTAIVSVSGRWIAYCPAAPSSQISLRASVPVPVYGRAPGLTSMTAPQLPPVNAEVDLFMTESVVNKVMRDATQEIIQGARWIGKQGMQAWNNYWNPQPNQQPRSPTTAPQGWGETSQFPPTHGPVTSQPVVKDPGMVSIIDIETLGSFSNLHPIATFSVPNGCSFLSLSPSGLSLFSASSKGDVQTVWDLMRIHNTRSSPLQAAASPLGGPRVRQVAHFSRMTVARIIDVAWTRPNGERIAMVTERGTVHILDLPPSAFSWPPPRRRRAQETKAAAAAASEAPTSVASSAASSAVSIASSALSSVRDVALPLINRHQRSSSSTQAATGSAIGGYAAAGGKVLAASITHSLGKTGNVISQLRHTGENRVSLPSSSPPGPSCVIWVPGKRNHSLFILGMGLVRTFPCRTRKADGKGGKGHKTLRLSRYKDHSLPMLPDDVLPPVVKRILDPEEYLDLAAAAADRDFEAGANTLVLNQPRPRVQKPYDLSAESAIPQAEIESSAPYQPFHTDRRVVLYELTPSRPTNTGSELQERDLSSLMSGAPLGDNTPLSSSPEPSSTPSRRGKKRQPPALPSPLPPPPAVVPAASSVIITNSLPSGAWVFGQPLPAIRLDVGTGHHHLLDDADDDSDNPTVFSIPLDSNASRALPAEAMERVLMHTDGGDTNVGMAQIVITTRKRRNRYRGGEGDEDGFFEDDCEVLDFADQRV